MGAASFHHEPQAGDDSGQAYSHTFAPAGISHDVPSPLSAQSQFNVLKLAGSILIVGAALYGAWRLLRRRK